MTIIAPFNLSYLLINVFAGSSMIFIGIALLAIAAFAGKMRMPNVIFGMIIALFGILMMSYAGWLYVIVLIVGGLLMGYVLSRLQR